MPILDEMEFKLVSEFPLYLVSNYGEVVKESGGLPLTKSPTQYGDLTVGLMKGNHQYRRSVKGLVARAFVPGETFLFDTPVLKDGNRGNLHHKNIVWRPRWFAIAYTKQFYTAPDWADIGPIMDLNTHHVYRSFMQAAIDTCSLVTDIRHGYLNGTKVFPTGHYFNLLDR